jgi:hypothetical protein
MLPELIRLLRKPRCYLASFRDGEIYIEETAPRRPVRARALQVRARPPLLVGKVRVLPDGIHTSTPSGLLADEL